MPSSCFIQKLSLYYITLCHIFCSIISLLITQYPRLYLVSHWENLKKKIVNFHTQTNILQLSNLVACADASSGCDVKCKFSNIHTGYCNKSSVCCSRMRMCFFMIKIVYGVCLIQTLGVVDEREQQNLIKSSNIYL